MRTVRTLLCVASLALAFVAHSQAHTRALGSQGLVVAMDNVTLVAFPKPVSTVYIGNASIAEVTVIDPRHIFLQGKRPGGTNLIALDKQKKLVSNQTVTVSNNHPGAVTVWRGADTFNYMCTNRHCETRPVPGDKREYFDETEVPATQHEVMGVGAAKESQPTMQFQH